jgi:hypothetical protein
VQRDGVKERLSLLYDFIERKRYISSRPPSKNIFELFGALFNKTRLRLELGRPVSEVPGPARRPTAGPPSYLPNSSTAHGHVWRPRPSLCAREAKVCIVRTGVIITFREYLTRLKPLLGMSLMRTGGVV